MLTPLLAKAVADLATSSASALAVPGILGGARSAVLGGDEDDGDGGEEDGVVLGHGSGGSLRMGGKKPAQKRKAQGTAALAFLGVDSWDGLGSLQKGELHRYRSPEDLEREADEREDLRRALSG